jgi:hypothetical protein
MGPKTLVPAYLVQEGMEEEQYLTDVDADTFLCYQDMLTAHEAESRPVEATPDSSPEPSGKEKSGH